MDAYVPITARWIVSWVALLVLAGCGGGGDGVSAVTYTGNTGQATVRTTNAARLTANVLGSSDAAGSVAGLSTTGSSVPQASAGLVTITLTLSNASRPAVRRAIQARGPAPVAGANVDVIAPCDGNNGSLRTTGTLDDVNATGTLTLTFSNCLVGSETLNGTSTVRVLAVDLVLDIPTHLIFSTARLTIGGAGSRRDTGGSVRVRIDGATETATSNLVVSNDLTRVMTMARNLVIVSESGTETITGRIFDDVHGFVDVTTPLSLTFATATQRFPDSGVMVLAGNNSGVVVNARSSTMVQLQPDSNGDGTADGFRASMKWTDLSGPIGADIADAPDGDGMHNSWETFYGLNPTVDDSAGNPDGGPNNLAEYLAGTNPTGP